MCPVSFDSRVSVVFLVSLCVLLAEDNLVSKFQFEQTYVKSIEGYGIAYCPIILSKINFRITLFSNFDSIVFAAKVFGGCSLIFEILSFLKIKKFRLFFINGHLF